MKLRNLIALVLALMMAATGFTAAHAEELPTVSAPRLASAAPQSEDWLDRLDQEALKQDLFDQFYECRRAIDIAKYRIPIDDLPDLLTYIQYELPEAFHLSFSGVQYLPNRTLVDTLYFNYLYTGASYYQKLEAVRSAARAMTADLKNLSPVQQALALHDRIALSCTYQEEPFRPNDYTLYGALIEGSAVCQGYALTYQYLLDRLEIESELCTSEDLNHAWNIVTLNGKQYHVDITWDDGLALPGKVLHLNFLRSTAGIISTGHTASDFNTAPTDTTYDHYDWQNVDTAYVPLRNELYYIDPTAACIRRYSDGAALHSLGTHWPANGGYYSGCFSTLACDGTYLLYSEYGTLYRFDPVAGTTQAVYTPAYSGSTTLNIYAFELTGSTLSFLLCSSPNFSPTNDVLRTVSTEYVLPLPFTTADAVAVMQHLIGKEITLDWSIMDRNLDDAITITDAVLILRALAD